MVISWVECRKGKLWSESTVREKNHFSIKKERRNEGKRRQEKRQGRRERRRKERNNIYYIYTLYIFFIQFLMVSL